MTTKLLRNIGSALLLLALTIVGNKSSAQSTVQIGSGTSTNSFFPLYTCYVYNYSQQVYWASELTAGGASGPSYISKIRFNPGATIQPSTNWQNWQLFLGNTTADGFATTSSWITGLTQVFSGTIATPVANTWLEFTLPTPFYWDGTSNLVVGTYENSPGYYCTQDWLSYSATAPVSGTRGILFYSDPTDPFATPSLPTANVSQNTLAQIQFEMTPAVACSGTPNAGTAVAPALMQCPNTAFPLSLSGSTAASGLTVQWQESLGGGIWSDITGATTKNYTVLSGASATTYYRAILTCTNSSLADTSTEDTVTVAPLFPGGTYTINSALPTGGTNYQTFTDAVAAMQCGIAGPVVFNVSAGTYNEKITLPATINATSTNTVTFNGNGATLVDSNATGGTNYATLRLDGADYITFKNLNIKANGLTYGFAVHLSNGADWNTFDSCTMSAKIAATSSFTGGVIMSGSATSATSTGANGSNNVFSNSTISGGYYAMQFYGNTVAGNQNNDVINCVVQDFYFYGIYYYQNTGALVSQNIVERPTRTSLSSFYGIYAGTGCTDMTIERNRVRNQFGGNPTYSGTSYNIYVNSTAAGVGTENRVYNNLVSNFNGNSSAYGIYMPSATNVQVYNNTVSIDNAAATSSSTIYGLYSTGTTNVDVKNNIISVTQGGTGTKYCIYFSTTTGKTSNYNNLYMGSTGGTANRIGYAGSAQNTFANWQAVNSNAYDQQGVSMDPMFVAPLSGNYTPGNAAFNDMGTPLAAITTDITGAARNATTPDIGAYEFSVAGCTGTPTAGIAYVDTLVCAGTPFTLFDTGFTVGAGITFQWEESPAGMGLWLPITAGTNASYNVSAGITAATDYRLVVTCTNSFLMDTSNVITVALDSFYKCYCSPLTGVTLHTCCGNYITNVGITTTTLNNSSTVAGAGYYTQYLPNVPSQTGTLTQGVPYTFNTTLAYSGYGADAWVDLNRNGLYESTEYFPFSGTSGSSLTLSQTLIIPYTSDTGLTGLRVRMYYPPAYGAANACQNYGSGYETEDYVVNLMAAPACSGTPNAGVAYGPAATCPGTPLTLMDSAATVGMGITMQWEESPSGMGVWTPITNATTPNYTITGGITAATDYRLVVTCTNSSQMDTSNVFTVTINSFLNCYCSSSAQYTGDEELFNMTISTLNNTTTCASVGPGPGSVQSMYSNYTTLPATPLSLGVTHPFSLTVGYCGSFAYSNVAAIYIDYNHNGLFTDLGENVYISTYGAGTVAAGRVLTGNITVPLTADTGITRMRVIAVEGSLVNPCGTYGWGETEDYYVNISAPVTCSGTPNAGVAYGPSSTCANTAFTLTDTASTLGMGITYQWEDSSSLGTWTPITNATNTSYTVASGISVATSYRLVVTCTNSSQMDTSNVVSLSILPAAQCYCIPGATNAGASDDITNVTFAGINNTTSYASSPGVNGYNNYTALTPAQVNRGNTSDTLSMSINYGGTEHGAVWADWDQNGVFDTYEFTYMGSGNAAPIQLKQAIPVPLTAAIGITRIRVRSQYSSAHTAADACIGYTYGETEDYSVNVGYPLSIALKDISAINMGAKNRVDWNTESEMQGDVFELQRSLDGKVFETIYVTPAKGAASRYSYVDNSPFQGVNYYRLNMKQSNGSNAYSKTVTATVTDKVFAMQAYPNPVSHVLTVAISGAQADDAMVQITDLTGKVLRSVAMPSATATIDMSGIASGVYLVKYVDANRTQTIRVTKQ